MAQEWVYEKIIPLPFGWSVIRLKPKFKKMHGDKFKSPMLHRKVQISPGYYREDYWPTNYLKHYK